MSPCVPTGRFRVIQPYVKDRAREATLISEHATAAEAFAEMARLSERMVKTGAMSDCIELIVVDPAGRVVPRPNAN